MPVAMENAAPGLRTSRSETMSPISQTGRPGSMLATARIFVSRSVARTAPAITNRSSLR